MLPLDKDVGLFRYGAGMTEDRKDLASLTPTTVTPPLSTVPFIVDTETDENGGTFLEPPLLLRSLRHISNVKTASRFRITGLLCSFKWSSVKVTVSLSLPSLTYKNIQIHKGVFFYSGFLRLTKNFFIFSATKNSLSRAFSCPDDEEDKICRAARN